MLKTNLKTIIVSGIAVVTLAVSCKKDAFVQEVECGYTGPSAYHFLSITDSLGRDLFDPKTPGFYPTHVVTLSNRDLIFRTNTEKEPNEPIRIILFFKEGERTAYLKLSDTDTDTIYTKYELVPQKCEPKYLLRFFKYNGKELADSAMQRYFTMVK
ncbi:hypothetical protein [Mucilaginibacter myungsuensis]|uniref:Lipoprotein n=1 Tax=Mucilaginibacter myungsuensis TaxID=649104 RepID=A0A929L5T1_9SPHI|nr:hypothetical protein [Mucilaginibacter myungsuensis]MBE9664515.1 hypothetical protein [Mucilaginibacter myungsuensis]MDN3601340.1 hypothetical protein [Mucilaginibacter myungsuensis]